MEAEGATKIIHRRETAAADNPHRREIKLGAVSTAFSNPYQAAERGHVDTVIQPTETRRELMKAFAMLRDKREVLPRRKHGNIPL